MELEIENTEVVSSNEIQVDVPTSIEVIEGEKDYEVSVVKKEYTIIGDSIFIPSMYEDAPPWLKEFINTTLEVAITNRDQSLIDRMEAILTLMDYVPKNQYTEQINQIVSEDGIINSRIATLNSNLTDAISSTNATVAEINLTYASKNEAAAIATNVITASLSGNGEIGSALIQLQEAYADLESTTAQSISMLESVMEGEINGNATAMETIRTYVGIDEAGAGTGTGLSAYLEASDGTIGGADSQLANDVRVTAEGVESKFAYNSVVNINGIYKRSGFGLTTNYTSGNGTQANPYISEFWIDASRFKFTNSNQTGQVAPFTIDATGATPQIAFNGIVNFSNVSNVQNSGSNLLYNSAPKIGYETKGWSIGWSNHGLSSNIGAGFDSWKPTGGASVFIQVHGSPAVGSVFDINNSSFPVVAGNKYEASAYISSHRCTSYVTIAWYNSSNTYISESSGTIVNLSSSGALSGWARSTLIVTAPTGAVKGSFYVRSSVTGDNPYCFVSYAFAGKVLSNQTVVSDWSEGTSVSISSGDVVTDINAGNTTTINGGKITTGSIAAAQIAAGTITADKISTYNLTAANSTFQNSIITNAAIANAAITNAKIGDAQITTAKIGDAQITNAKIGTASIDTLKIQGESVVVTRYAEGVNATIWYTPAVSHGVVITCNCIMSWVLNMISNAGNSGIRVQGLNPQPQSFSVYRYLNAGVSYYFTSGAVSYNSEREEYPPSNIIMMGAKR